MPQPGVGDNAPLRPVGGGAPHQGRSHAPPQRHQVVVGRPMPGPRRGTNVGGQAAQARLGGRHVEVRLGAATLLNTGNTSYKRYLSINVYQD